MNGCLAYFQISSDGDWLEGTDYPELQIERQGDRVQIRLVDRFCRPSITSLFRIMQCVAQIGASQNTKMVWTFSAVAVDMSELTALLDRWAETHEPPVLSIIALTLGKRRHETRGMETLVGFELAATFDGPAQSRDAARTLARLARYALMHGGIAQGSVFEAVDGRLLHLNWQDCPSATHMVTIAL